MPTNEPAMLPIREVSRMTGVNSVTLRAWERRYGLIKPHRTPKGHRLYSDRHLAQIQSILTWLERGVAVSQVKELLERPNQSRTAVDSPWQQAQQDLLNALLAFDPGKLEHIYNQAAAQYPVRTLCTQLLEPLLQHLEQRWQGQFGSQLEQVFAHTWLRSKLATRLYHNNCHSQGPRLVLASLSDQHCEPGLWLLALLLSNEGCHINLLEWEVPASELGLLCEHNQAKALIMFSSQALPAAQLRRQLPKLSDHHDTPLFMAGPAAIIHDEELIGLGIQPLADLPSRAHSRLLTWLQEDA